MSQSEVVEGLEPSAGDDGPSAASPVEAAGDDVATHATDRPGKPAIYTQVVRGSVWFTVAVGIGAVGGLAYLSIAARINVDDRSVVGGAGFLFQALLCINWLTSMGIPVAVARFAPANNKSVNTLFNWALIYTAASSLVGTLAFFIVAKTAFEEQTAVLFQWGWVSGLLLFFVLLTGQSFAMLVEIRLVTMRLWSWVMSRVIFVVVLRLALFGIPSLATNPVGLFFIMAATPALSGFIGAIVLYFVHPKHDRGGLFPLPSETRLVLRYATVNWVAMLAAQAPQFLSPIIVGKFVDKNEYGAFFVAWTIVTVVFLVPHTVGQTVLSEGSRAHADVERQAKLGLFVAGGFMIVMTIGAYVFGGFAVNLLFGKGYDLALDILPRMVAAGVPWALTAILLARARVYQHQVTTVIITGGFAIATLIPVSLLAAATGVPGAATAWLIGNVVAAFLALAASVLWRRPGEGLPFTSSAVEAEQLH